jgi:hypothetical protein
MNQKDVMNILVARDVGTKSTANATGTAIATYTDLKDGEMVVTNPHNVVIGATEILTDALVAKYGFKFIVRKGTLLDHSDLIKIDNIRSCDGIVDSAAAAQVSYIGYNGSSGAIVNNDNVPYVPRFIMHWKDRAGQGQQLILDGVFKSGASAKASDVTIGLLQSLDNMLSRQNYIEPIVVNAVCSAAVTAGNCFDNDATVVKGSKVFAVGTNLNYGGVALVIGDYVRMQGPTASTTALTDSVYEVVAINTLNVTVDRPIKEASGTYAAAGDELEVIPAATGDAANWGIKCTGQTRQYTPGKWRYSVVRFEIGLNDSFGATTVTYTTAASLGVGTSYQVGELEWELKGNVGLVYAADHLHPTRDFTLVVDHTAATVMYDQIAISWFDNKPTNAVDVSNSAKQLILASVTGYANGEPFDLVADAIEALGWDLGGVAV